MKDYHWAADLSEEEAEKAKELAEELGIKTIIGEPKEKDPDKFVGVYHSIGSEPYRFTAEDLFFIICIVTLWFLALIVGLSR